MNYDDRIEWTEAHDQALERTRNPNPPPPASEVRQRKPKETQIAPLWVTMQAAALEHIAQIATDRDVMLSVVRDKRDLPFAVQTNLQLLVIVEIVCTLTNVPKSEIFAKNRYKSIAEARQLVCYLARHHTQPQLSYPELGRALGGRDHTTIISAVKRVERRRRADLWLDEVLRTVGDLIAGRAPRRVVTVESSESEVA